MEAVFPGPCPFLARTRRFGRGYSLAVDATTTPAAVAPVSARREGLAWAFVGVLLFSFSVPLTKEAVGGFSPYLTATGRAVIAGVIAAALLAVTRAQLPPAHLRRHGLEADIEWCARENTVDLAPRYVGAVGPAAAVAV